MKTKSLILSVLVALVLAAVTAFANGEKIQAPSYLDGEYWTFKAVESNFISNRSNPLHGDYEVVYAAGEFRVSKIDGDQKTAVSADEVEEMKLFFASPGKEQRFLDFPLFVGHKWSGSYYRGAMYGFKAQWRKVESAVESEEAIAGLMKISRRVTGAGPRLEIYSLWYDPELKAVVKYEYDSSGGSGQGGKREIKLVEHGRRHPDIASR